MSNILLKIPDILSDEDGSIVKTFLETEKRIHKQLKEHKKKEKLERQEKKRQPKEEMIQQYAEKVKYKTGTE
jgi:hypothetical protein